MRKNRLAADLAIVALFAGVGWASRLLLVADPNIKPCAALAMFAALLVTRWWLAVLVAPLMMALSDWWLGGPDLPIAAAVQASLLLNFAVFRKFRGALGFSGPPERETSPPHALADSGTAAIVLTLLGSLQFYLLTNAAVWAGSGWYPLTWAGLVDCFTRALPFFGRTLLGDLLFGGMPLLGWILVRTAVRSGQRSPEFGKQT